MAIWKHLSLICEITNFANAYLGEVTKFQGYSLLFWSSEQFTGLEVKTPFPPSMNRVKSVSKVLSPRL